MQIRENLSTPVKFDCDVLVAGGGIAGIAAALYAQGASVEICELQKKLTDRGVVLHEKDL